jgi:hypothetical protein
MPSITPVLGKRPGCVFVGCGVLVTTITIAVLVAPVVVVATGVAVKFAAAVCVAATTAVCVPLVLPLGTLVGITVFVAGTTVGEVTGVNVGGTIADVGTTNISRAMIGVYPNVSVSPNISSHSMITPPVRILLNPLISIITTMNSNTVMSAVYHRKFGIYQTYSLRFAYKYYVQ